MLQKQKKEYIKWVWNKGTEKKQKEYNSKEFEKSIKCWELWKKKQEMEGGLFRRKMLARKQFRSYFNH
jgi:hypothetical protein